MNKLPPFPIGQVHTEHPGVPAPRRGALLLNVAVDFGTGLEVLTNFKLVHFKGQEAVSQPFSFELELHGNAVGRSEATQSPTRTDFTFDQIIGRPITVGIGVDANYPDSLFDSALGFKGAAGRGNHPSDTPLASSADGLSLFNGIVTDVSISRLGVYHLTMQPSLHRLGLTNNYRIFQNLRLWEVVEQVLADHTISGADVDFSQLQRHVNLANIRQQDWLQAGETDLEFVQDLMRKANLYYYFVHRADRHVLVVSNSTQYPGVFTDPDKTVRYSFTSDAPDGLEQENVILSFSYRKKLIASQVRALVTKTTPAGDLTGWDTGEVPEVSMLQGQSIQMQGY